jgi:hypothetical protein
LLIKHKINYQKTNVQSISAYYKSTDLVFKTQKTYWKFSWDSTFKDILARSSKNLLIRRHVFTCKKWLNNICIYNKIYIFKMLISYCWWKVMFSAQLCARCARPHRAHPPAQACGMHTHAVHTHAVHSMFYLRINSNTPTEFKHPNQFSVDKQQWWKLSS